MALRLAVRPGAVVVMHDAHFSMGAVLISSAGHVGACCPSTINQGDEGCDDNRAHGDRDGMLTAKAMRSYEHREIVPPLRLLRR